MQKAVVDSVATYEEHVKRYEILARQKRLTPRECQVLDLVVAGESNKRIARRLNISDKTVEIHRAKVMEKMQAKSLAELVKMVSTVQHS